MNSGGKTDDIEMEECPDVSNLCDSSNPAKASTAIDTDTLQKQSLFEIPQVLTDVPAAYILRRVVGVRNFWLCPAS
jgi:hypothetical protein